MGQSKSLQKPFMQQLITVNPLVNWVKKLFLVMSYSDQITNL